MPHCWKSHVAAHSVNVLIWEFCMTGILENLPLKHHALHSPSSSGHTPTDLLFVTTPWLYGSSTRPHHQERYTGSPEKQSKFKLYRLYIWCWTSTLLAETYCLLIIFADSWSGSKQFDILMVFLKELFKPVNFKQVKPNYFETSQQTTFRQQKKHEKLPSMQMFGHLWKYNDIGVAHKICSFYPRKPRVQSSSLCI